MRAIVLALLAFMLGILIWASLEIPLWIEWASLKQSPWFLATLADLYTGIILFSLFTFLIKRSLSHTGVWTLLFCSLGNIATLIWVIIYRKDIDERLR